MRTKWTAVALILSVLCFASAFSQTPQPQDQFETSLLKLPPDQRVYERFRHWVTAQPVDVQRSPDRMQKYRAYLNAKGFTEADIEAQIVVVTNQGRNLEAERWNRILTAEEPTFNIKANGFLVEMVKGRKPGLALDVGMGQGRNAIWLAQNGWTVTGFDPADKAVALANQTAERLGVHLNTEIT
ncbi:MAG: methyltransferase domain-containing protein, partial [Acidobacteriaceae bacterium]|nr:methyltransferase domain-containing protein [Acidobacteriaceae bacterium]